MEAVSFTGTAFLCRSNS